MRKQHKDVTGLLRLIVKLFFFFVKVKLYKPLGLQDVEVPRISEQLAHEGSNKAVSPTHRAPLRPRRYLWYSYLLEAESTPEP